MSYRNYQAIPQYEVEDPVSDIPHPTKSRRLAGAALAILGMFGVIAYAASASFSSGSSDASNLASSSTELELNVYNPTYGKLASLEYLPWTNLAEPYINSYVEIVSIQGYSASQLDVSSIVWQVDGEQSSDMAGTNGLCNFGAVGWHSVSVSATTRSGVSVSGTAQVMVKYVRREVRSLTEEDRTTMFAAMKAVYTISTEEGQAKYGSKFHNIEDFVVEHLLGAGTIECDHWHDGAGIMVHHVAFTLQFEQAMQAVDPTVALAYWEYGLDSELTDYSTSPIFSEDMYGELNPLNDEHTMSSGTWAYTPIADGAEYANSDSSSWGSSFNPMVNAYGQLRTPWNNNPSAYIGRHNSTNGANMFTIPGCSLFSDCYDSTTIADMNACLNGNTHGPVHILVGGSWGNEDLFNQLPPESVDNWKGSGPLYFKLLWRNGLTRCPTSCDSTEECKCSIPTKYFEKYGATGILEMAGLDSYISGNVNNAVARIFLSAVEDAGYVGEMYTSAAPYDPTFWPLHGAADRLLGRKRIMKSLGRVEFDETWGYGANSAPYIAGYCDWSNVQSDDDFPVCDETADCYGHGEDDDLPFEDLLTQGTVTNAEFFDLMHPWTESLPYTYDSFDYGFCEEEGYSF